jgi:hypothetical protein
MARKSLVLAGKQEAWKKQQEEFQAILVNLGMGQQLPQRHENEQEGQNS